MKLTIKKKNFDDIQSGKKHLEWRDSHITFVCEETGETLRKNIISVSRLKKLNLEYWNIKGMSNEDDYVICFELE